MIFSSRHALVVFGGLRGLEASLFSTKSMIFSSRHALVVFGGVRGLEASLEADENLDVDDPSLLFQHYLNACPSQGSRTIRTEVGPDKKYSLIISSGFD